MPSFDRLLRRTGELPASARMHGARTGPPTAFLRQRQRGSVVRMQDRRRDVQPASHDILATGGLQHGPRAPQEGRDPDRTRRRRQSSDVQQSGVLL